MKSHTEFSPSDTLESLAEDARTLLAATADVAEEHVAEARERLAAALADGRQTWSHIRQRCANGVKATDRTIRAHPYQAIMVALGIGAIAGLMIRRLR